MSCLPIVGCTKQPDAVAVATEVNALVKTHIDGFIARDAIKATSIDAPDFIGIFHGAPNTVGPEQDLAASKQMVADPALKLVIENEHLDVAKSGDMATWRSTYRFTYTEPATKQARVEIGNFLLGFKRQPDGKMKAAWSVVADASPPPDGRHSSPNLFSTRSHKAASAPSAPSPLALIVTLSPIAAPSIINPMIDVPATFDPSFSTSIAAVWPAASVTNLALARA